ncbi:MAG: FAD-dependent oxidoreductase [Hyphomicrobiales bacterium]|nr:FAD-dependent oxidoreductase [Hyphomicrobiales bacterium]
MQHERFDPKAPPSAAPDERVQADICIIGAGSAGLSVAAGAAQMGAKVVLIEKGEMGGDCLNTGCVPSKALIAAAHAAHAPKTSAQFGVHLGAPRVDFAAVHAHVHGVIAAIAPHDSVERFEGFGVRVIQERGAFISKTEVRAGAHVITARRFVIATGSGPAAPPIPGLAEAGYLTNETVFDLKEQPEHLVVIGGGPIGVEMAQAFRRLGSEVTLIERFGILAKDEPEAVAVVREALIADGVRLMENTGVSSVARDGAHVRILIEANGATETLTASHVLVAAGRKPNLSGLNLEAAGVAYTAKGVTVDARLRTSNTRVFAIGDAAGGPQFTHIAGYHAGIVIRNALFAMPSKVDYSALPWVTYADPELAHVGLTEAEARAAGHTPKLLTWRFADNDRAQTERRTEGLAKIVLSAKGKILGATIVGPHAGELILTWGLAISSGLGISKVASLIAPYPTLSEISKRAAGSHFTPSLFNPRTRAVVRFIQRVLP